MRSVTPVGPGRSGGSTSGNLGQHAVAQQRVKGVGLEAYTKSGRKARRNVISMKKKKEMKTFNPFIRYNKPHVPHGVSSTPKIEVVD
jgi:hypothetical protein